MQDHDGPAPTARHPEPTRLLTVGEVAERLTVCRSTVYNLISAGRLPAHRFGKGKIRRAGIRVSETAVDDFLTGSSAEAA